MQQTELAQRHQLAGAHMTHRSNAGVLVVMVTAQFPDVVVATVPHTRSSKTQYIVKTKTDTLRPKILCTTLS